MRSFESRPPRNDKKPDAGTQTTPSGHVYKSKPTPGQPATTGEGPATPGAENGSAPRVYYSKKYAGATAKTGRFTQKQLRLNLLLVALILLLILLLVMAALLPGCHQTPPAASSGSLSTLSTPSSSDSYDMNALAIPVGEFAGTILEETEEADDDYVEDTLFIGDSNTERMLHYNSVTGVSMLNGIGIESMGIGSVTGLRCVRFSGYSDMTIPQAVPLMQPRRIVIMYGTNNVGAYVDNFIAQYENAIAAIEKAWPYADIIIGSVLPVTANCSYGSISQKAIDEFNLALVEMAKEHDYKFLNWCDALKDTKTGYAKQGTMIGDGVHVSEKGMEALFEYFRTHSYITDDTRPKPLKAVPVRLPTPEGLFPKPDSSSSSKASEDSSGGGSSSSSSKSSSSDSNNSSSQSQSQSSSSSSPQQNLVSVPAWNSHDGSWTVVEEATEDTAKVGTQYPSVGAQIDLNTTPKTITLYIAKQTSPSEPTNPEAGESS